MKDLKKLFDDVKKAASEGKLGKLVDRTAEDLVQKTMQEAAPLVDKINAKAKELGADEALARLQKTFSDTVAAGQAHLKAKQTAGQECRKAKQAARQQGKAFAKLVEEVLSSDLSQRQSSELVVLLDTLNEDKNKAARDYSNVDY